MKICLNCNHLFSDTTWQCPQCNWTPVQINGFLAFAPEMATGTDTYESDFFSLLVKVEPGNFWFETRNELIVWVLQRYFPNIQRFLEIGCGTGFVASNIQKRFPHAAVSGSELLSNGLPFSRKRLPQATLFQMDARCIPFSEEFDVIGAFDVLEHIPEDELVIAQMFKAIKPGGGIVVTVPQHDFLWSVTDDFSHHQRRYSRRDMLQKITAAGFIVQYCTSFVSLLLPMMWLSRRLQKPTNQDLGREFNMGHTLNRLLRVVMIGERILIQSGLVFPAGGSLIIVAKKPTK